MSDCCTPEAAPVLHSCYDAKIGTKVPGDMSAQSRKKDQECRTRCCESLGRARGGIGGWRLLTSYGKVHKSSGGDADGWMACVLPFPFDTVHHQWDSDP